MPTEPAIAKPGLDHNSPTMNEEQANVRSATPAVSHLNPEGLRRSDLMLSVCWLNGSKEQFERVAGTGILLSAKMRTAAPSPIHLAWTVNCWD